MAYDKERSFNTNLDNFNEISEIYSWEEPTDRKFELLGDGLKSIDMLISYHDYLNDLLQAIAQDETYIEYTLDVEVNVNEEPFVGKLNATPWITSQGGIVYTNLNLTKTGERIFDELGNSVGVVATVQKNETKNYLDIIVDLDGNTYNYMGASKYGFKLSPIFSPEIGNLEATFSYYTDVTLRSQRTTRLRNYENTASIFYWDDNIENKKFVISGNHLLTTEVNFNYTDYLELLKTKILNGSMPTDNILLYEASTDIILNEQPFVGLKNATCWVYGNDLVFTNSNSPTIADKLFDIDGNYIDMFIVSTSSNQIISNKQITYSSTNFSYKINIVISDSFNDRKANLSNTLNPNGVTIDFSTYSSENYKWDRNLDVIEWKLSDNNEYLEDTIISIDLKAFYNNVDKNTEIAIFDLIAEPIQRTIYSWDNIYFLSETPNIGDYAYYNDGEITDLYITNISGDSIRLNNQTIYSRTSESDIEIDLIDIETKEFIRTVYVALEFMSSYDDVILSGNKLLKDVKLSGKTTTHSINNVLFKAYEVQFPIYGSLVDFTVNIENIETKETIYTDTISYDFFDTGEKIIVIDTDNTYLYEYEYKIEVPYYAWEDSKGNVYYTKDKENPTEIYKLENDVYKSISNVSNIKIAQDNLTFTLLDSNISAKRDDSLDTIVDAVQYFAWILPNGTVVYTTSLANPDFIYILLDSKFVLYPLAENISVNDGNISFISQNNEYIANREETNDLLVDDNSIVTEKTNFVMLDSGRTDILVDRKPDFNIDRFFIQQMIPTNLRKTWVFERVADILYAVVSGETPNDTETLAYGEKIRNYYYDIAYFNSDYEKMTVEMKLAKLHDMGFDFLVDLFTLGVQDEITINNRLNNLTNFLNLIKTLKGRKEGFDLILKLLNFSYTLTSWEEPDYEGDIFTMTISIGITEDQKELPATLTNTIQQIARAYLAPQLKIITKVVYEPLKSEASVEGNHYFINRYSGGYVSNETYKTFTITRSII